MKCQPWPHQQGTTWSTPTSCFIFLLHVFLGFFRDPLVCAPWMKSARSFVRFMAFFLELLLSLLQKIHSTLFFSKFTVSMTLTVLIYLYLYLITVLYSMCSFIEKSYFHFLLSSNNRFESSESCVDNHTYFK